MRPEVEQQWKKQLALHGVPITRLELCGPVYRLAMAQYDIVAIGQAVPPFRTNTLYFAPMRPDDENRHHRRLARMAARALYAMQCDDGEVTLGVDGDGQIGVLAVNLGRRSRRKTARQSEEIGAKSALLGADTETVLLNKDGKIVPAAKYVPRRGIVGSDVVIVRGRRVLHPLLEIRPEPSADPLELVRAIRAALMDAEARIAGFEGKWLAGGMPVKGLPLGGHIHFSGIELNTDFVRVLDNYLALPLILAEDPSSAVRRPRYGFLGDVRRKPHGGFEYRTLPSWIVSPQIAAGTLVLARLIADHFPALGRRPLQDRKQQVAYYAGDKLQLIGPVREIWTDLEALPAYRRYADRLEPFKRQLFSLRPWRENGDIRPRWNVL